MWSRKTDVPALIRISLLESCNSTPIHFSTEQPLPTDYGVHHNNQQRTLVSETKLRVLSRPYFGVTSLPAIPKKMNMLFPETLSKSNRLSRGETKRKGCSEDCAAAGVRRLTAHRELIVAANPASCVVSGNTRGLAVILLVVQDGIEVTRMVRILALRALQ